METSRRISKQALVALAIGAGFVVAGIAMIVVGWPEQHPWQTVTLQLSGVMFALATATAIFHLVSQRDLIQNPTPRFRLVRAVTVTSVAAGALFYVLAFALGNFTLAPLGQFFIWVGLGAMFAYLAAGAIRREQGQWRVEEELGWDDLVDDDEG